MPQGPLVAKGIPVLSARELRGREVPRGLAWRSGGSMSLPHGTWTPVGTR